MVVVEETLDSLSVFSSDDSDVIMGVVSGAVIMIFDVMSGVVSIVVIEGTSDVLIAARSVGSCVFSNVEIGEVSSLFSSNSVVNFSRFSSVSVQDTLDSVSAVSVDNSDVVIGVLPDVVNMTFDIVVGSNAADVIVETSDSFSVVSGENSAVVIGVVSDVLTMNSDDIFGTVPVVVIREASDVVIEMTSADSVKNFVVEIGEVTNFFGTTSDIFVCMVSKVSIE